MTPDEQYDRMVKSIDVMITKLNRRTDFLIWASRITTACAVLVVLLSIWKFLR